MARVRLLTPTQSTQVAQNVNKMQTMRPTQPIQKLSPDVSIATQRLIRDKYKQSAQNKQVETFLSNYSDPTELNSFIDALTNREAVSKKFGEAWGTASTLSGTVAVLSFAGSIIAKALATFVPTTAPVAGPIAAALKATAKIAAIPSIPASVDVTYNTAIKPIVKGKPNEAILNTLINMGETLDATANPVKGLILEGPEGFIKATGLSSEGRTNYDYDTGFFLTDMLLEVVTDPLNWVQIAGAKHFAKTATKEFTPKVQALAEVLQKADPKLITDEVKEKFTKAYTQSYVDAAERLAKIDFNNLKKTNPIKYAKTIRKTRDRLEATYKRLLKEYLPADTTYQQIDTIFRKQARDIQTGKFVKSAKAQIDNFAMDTLANDVIKGAYSLTGTTNEFEWFLAKNALFTSGYGLGMEAVKYAGDPIRKWQNERIITALDSLKKFDRKNGIKLTEWDSAKAIWTQYQKALTKIADKKALRDLPIFYTLANEQFNRDLFDIRQILIDSIDKQNLRIGKLNDLFQTRQGLNFTDYVKVVQEINAKENNRFEKYVINLLNVQKTLEPQALKNGLGGKSTPITQIVKPYVDPEAIIKSIDDLLKHADAEDPGRKWYSFKINEVNVIGEIINDKTISDKLTEIATSDKVGALLDKVLRDAEAISPEKVPQIRVAVQTIKEAGVVFTNIKQLFNHIEEAIFPEIDKIKPQDFKRYVLDQIFGLKGTAKELSVSFDTTLDTVLKGLEILCEDVGFKVMDYPGLDIQIGSILKSFLNNQRDINVTYISTAIVEDFTTSVNTLIAYMPSLKEELAELSAANLTIYKKLKNIKMINESLLATGSNLHTIFDALSSRQLTDFGYARKTIGTLENLKYFNLPKNAGTMVPRLEALGKTINRIKEGMQTWGRSFTDAQIDEMFSDLISISDDFEAFFDFKLLDFDMLEKDPEAMLAIIMETSKFAKTDGDVLWPRFYNQILRPLNAKQRSEIINFERLFKTDFAWEPMARTAALAEQHFQEGLLNLINNFKGVSLNAKKFKKDYIGILDSISKGEIDRTRVMYLERYIRKLEPYVTFFDNFEQYVYNLIDLENAEQQIEFMYEMLAQHPRLGDKYHGLMMRISAALRGEMEFEQDAKYYIKKGITPDGRKPVDTWTPFYEETKAFNKELVTIQRQQVTLQAMQKVLSKDLYQKWFVTNNEAGEEILSILNDATRQLTNADYELYYMFLRDAADDMLTTRQSWEIFSGSAGVDGYLNIAWEFIPAQIKELDFKYFYEILGIEDPRLTFNMWDRGILGWHTRSANDIVHAITDPKLNPIYTGNPLAEMFITYLHESGHNILERLFKTDTERKAYVNNVIERMQEYFGETYVNNYLTNLRKNYRNIDDAKEELFVRSLSPESYMNLEAREFLNADIDNVTLVDLAESADTRQKFAQELMLELQEKAKPLRANITEDYTTAVYNHKSHLRFNNDNIKTIDLYAPFKKVQEFNKVVNTTTDRLALAGLTEVLKLEPDAFIEELAHRGRFITFTDIDLQRSSTLNALRKRLGKYFTVNPEKVLYHYDTNNGRYWFVLRKEQTVDYNGFQTVLNGNPLIRNRIIPTYNEVTLIDDAITDTKTAKVAKMYRRFNEDMYDLTGGNIGYSQGDVFTEEMYNIIMHVDKQTKAATHIPQIIWDELNGARLGKSFFENTHFNESVLGTAASRRKLGMYSSNIITNMNNALTLAQNCTKAKVEYVNTAFDSMFSIANKTGVFGNFTDAELLEALQMTDEVQLMVLAADNKWGIKARRVLPTSVEAIAQARRLGGVIVSNQVAKDMYNVVNHRLGSIGFAKLWSRIMFTYKFGYLCRLGSFLRNAIDTHLKSTLEMKSETAEYLGLSYKICKDVDHLKDYLRKVVKENPNVKLDTGMSIKEHIQTWFKNNNAKVLTYEQYLELDRDFFSQAISGNIMHQLIKDTPAEDAWTILSENLGKVTDMGNWFETPNRLAVYLYNLDKGLSYSGAMNQLAKVHFDYSFKSTSEQLIDMIFPFTTFSLRNYSYWVEALDNHPWLLRNYTHIMKPSWDFKDYTPEELATDYRVQAQIRYGQIKLAEFNNKVLTFKANPSIQDAIQMFSDPINNVYEKLAAPIAYPLSKVTGDYAQPLNMLPIVGPTAQMVKGLTDSKPGFSLSTIGVIPKRTQQTTNIKFSNKNYSGINSYKDSQYRVPTYRKNVVYDAYATKGITKYRTNMFPIIDVYHDIKSKYTVNVYNRIKNQVKTDVYRGIRYSLKLDVNRWR